MAKKKTKTTKKKAPRKKAATKKAGGKKAGAAAAGGRSLNQGLSAAKAAKKDEFYTQYIDIQKEVEAYLEHDPKTFKGKVVYCNCDDPFESNFFKYFASNFNRLGLKKLISTSYDGSTIAGQGTLFEEYNAGNGGRKKPKAVAVTLDHVKDENGDGAVDIEDVKLFLKRNKAARVALKGNDQYPGGDFRSPECVALLKEADIVVTNPPFSLFREYVKHLVEHGKKFLIIGNQNAITYKEIFPLIKDNKLWLGVDNGGTKWFQVQDDYDIKTKTRIKVIDGVKFFSMGSIMWYTNLDHSRRHQPLKCMTMAENLKFSRNLKGKKAYDRYDNYDAIEVGTYKDIPSDYEGVMGVPITFLDKYSPEQFDILGATQRGCHDLVPDTRKYDDYWEVRQDGSRTGSSGGKTNENANLIGNDGRKNYFENSEGRIIQSAYQRIFIRHRNPKGKKK